MTLKLVYNISSHLNISFDHDVESEDLADVVGEDVVEDYRSGKLSERELMDLIWEQNKDYMADLVHQYVEVDFKLEEN